MQTLRRPLIAAFMPEVPLASSGAIGLLSHTSTPVSEPARQLQVVVLEEDDPPGELLGIMHELA